MDKDTKVVCPPMWEGQEKVKGIFSCGACPNPQRCADNDHCERVTAYANIENPRG